MKNESVLLVISELKSYIYKLKQENSESWYSILKPLLREKGIETQIMLLAILKVIWIKELVSLACLVTAGQKIIS